MLRGIHSKTGNAEANQVVQIVGNLGANRRFFGGKVGKPAEHTAGGFPKVVVVCNIAVTEAVFIHAHGRVKVTLAIQTRVVKFRELGAVPANTRRVGHVVDHGVDDDHHAGLVAGLGHRGELGAGA